MLTPRERQIADLLHHGFSNKEISDQLRIKVGTVKGYMRVLFTKLKVNNRTRAAIQARKTNKR